MKSERPRPEDVRYFQAYAEELREAFRGGLLYEFTRLRQPQFVVWKTQEIDGKTHKPPYSPIYHRLADTANPASWGTLPQALKALSTGYYNGIGFVFSNSDPYAGMDLDHCVGTNRSINKRERDIIDFLQTHTHYSPRDGVHLLFEIDKKRFPGQNRKEGNFEFFTSNHYLTITSRLVPNTPKTIEKRHVEAAYIYLSLIPPEPKLQEVNTKEDMASPLWTPASEHTEHRGDVGIGDILAQLPPEASRHAELQRLLSGDITGYKSQSSADFVLIMILLHWTGDDKALTRRLFLSSPLGKRGKAQRKTGDTTYIDLTIENVIKKRRNPPMRR